MLMPKSPGKSNPRPSTKAAEDFFEWKRCASATHPTLPDMLLFLKYRLMKNSIATCDGRYSRYHGTPRYQIFTVPAPPRSWYFTVLFFEVLNQNDLDFCTCRPMGHAYSSQAIVNLKVKDIAQRLGLGKRGSCDLDWGQFDWYHGMCYVVQFLQKNLARDMKFYYAKCQTAAQMKNNS